MSPIPNENETKEEYISRCIPFMIENEGKEQDEAAAICYSMWEDHNSTNEGIVKKINTYLKEEKRKNK